MASLTWCQRCTCQLLPGPGNLPLLHSVLGTLPRRSCSCFSDKLCWTGRTGRSAQTLWINSDQEPLAKRSNLWANSLLPTEPVPLGLCIIGIKQTVPRACFRFRISNQSCSEPLSQRQTQALPQSATKMVGASSQHGHPDQEDFLHIELIQLGPI